MEYESRDRKINYVLQLPLKSDPGGHRSEGLLDKESVGVVEEYRECSVFIHTSFVLLVLMLSDTPSLMMRVISEECVMNSSSILNWNVVQGVYVRAE